MANKFVSTTTGKEVTSTVNAATAPVGGSLTGEALKAHLALYKLQNPVKWASKKEETKKALENKNLPAEEIARLKDKLDAFGE